MTLKNAAFLALIGTLLLTVYLLASLSVTVFFYVFNRAQSR